MPLVLTEGGAGPAILPAVEQGNSGWHVVLALQAGGAGGVDDSPNVDPWAPGGLMPGWEYGAWHDLGFLPPEDPEPVPDTEPEEILRAFGPRVEGGDAQEAFGQVGGRVEGVLGEIGVIVATEGAPMLAGYLWFVTKGDDAVELARGFRKTPAKEYPPDFQSRQTIQRSGVFNSEGHAQQLAREKLGRDSVDIGDNKWRSVDGKWQCRAKDADTSQNHIHLERLDPETGEVLENWHFNWPKGTER